MHISISFADQLPENRFIGWKLLYKAAIEQGKLFWPLIMDPAEYQAAILSCVKCLNMRWTCSDVPVMWKCQKGVVLSH